MPKGVAPSLLNAITSVLEVLLGLEKGELEGEAKQSCWLFVAVEVAPQGHLWGGGGIDSASLTYLSAR